MTDLVDYNNLKTSSRLLNPNYGTLDRYENLLDNLMWMLYDIRWR